MFRNLIAILILVCLPQFLLAQGADVNGLKVGPQISDYESNGQNYTETGYYKLVPLSKYDTVRLLSRQNYEVKFKNALALLYYSGRSGDTISVQDSIWSIYNDKGDLIEMSSWLEGIHQSTKHFEQGMLTEVRYEDYDHDTSFHLTYHDGRLFKKEFYPPEDKTIRQ